MTRTKVRRAATPVQGTDLRALAQRSTPDPDLGPSHLYGDHTAGSYRRWVLAGGLDRAEAAEEERKRADRRRVSRALWQRVHPDAMPPDVVNLRNYAEPCPILRECWQAWHTLAEHVAALPPPGDDPTTTTDAAGPRAGHLTTTDEGSALAVDQRNAG